jgi:hypothetical protein
MSQTVALLRRLSFSGGIVEVSIVAVATANFEIEFLAQHFVLIIKPELLEYQQDERDFVVTATVTAIFLGKLDPGDWALETGPVTQEVKHRLEQVDQTGLRIVESGSVAE